MTARKTYLTLILSLCLCGFSGSAGYGQESDPVEMKEEAIDSLRNLGDYSQALKIAVELSALLKADPEMSVYEIEDAGRLVETLRFISGRTESAQEEFAQADRMTGQYMELYENGDMDSAAAVAKEQYLLRQHLFGKAHIEIAGSMSNCAYLMQDSGHRHKAVTLYREAVAIEEKVLSENHPDKATDYMNLAGVLHDLTLLNEAESYYRKALQIFMQTEGPESDNVAWALASLGSLMKEKGEYETSEMMLKNALIIYRTLYGEVDYDVALAMNSLGVLYQVKGEYLEAEPLFLEALKIFGEVLDPDDTDIAMVLSNLASLMQDKGDYSQAESYYKKALAIYDSADESGYKTSVTLNNLADLYHDIRDYSRADSLYRTALDIRQDLAGTGSSESAILILNTARNCRDMKDFECAEPLYRESGKLFKSCLGDSNPLIAMHQFSWSNYYSARGIYEKAEEVLLDAIPVYEASRRRLSPGLSRATFQNSPYPMLSNAYLRQGKTGLAWPSTEKYFGRALVDILFASDLEQLSFEELRMDDSLRAAVGELESVLSAYQDGMTTEELEKKILETRLDLFKTESAWSLFQNEMADKYNFAEVKTFSLEQIQHSLSERSAIIGWLDIEESRGEFVSWSYVVRHTGPVVWARVKAGESSDTRSPHDRMWMFRSTLTQPRAPIRAVRREASRIWKERFLPVEEAFEGIEDLIVIPSGAMLGIPVEAIVDDEGRLLVERFSVSYTPSATIYSWLKEKSSSQSGKSQDMTLCIGDPPFNKSQLDQMTGVKSAIVEDGKDEKESNDRSAGALTRDAISSLRRLPGTRSEVEAIAGIVPGATVLLGLDASEENLYRMATGSDSLELFSVIHIASHAIINDKAPERSCLVLSQCGLSDQLEDVLKGGRNFDGLVSTREMIDEWNLGAELVTLSACETGLGKNVGGEGYIGFSNALLQAGARSLVVSLWKVEDTATSMLMKRFYENYFGEYEETRDGKKKERMGKSEALQEAKNWLRSYSDDSGEIPYEHPFYWSAFILIGNRERH